MAPCLSKLPSLCLEAIFSHVPLVDLYRSIGLVCTTWYSSRRTALLRRRRLVIVGDEELLEELDQNFICCSHDSFLMQHVRHEDGSPWLSLESLDQIKLDALVVPYPMLTNTFLSSLVNLSNITHLTLIFDAILNRALTQIIRLIDNFSQHLVDLKLRIVQFTDNDFDGDFDDNTEEKLALNVTNLFACLDRLHTLRHLRLGLDFSNLQIRPQLSFLSRLSTFAIFVEAEVVDWIFTSLILHGENVNSVELFNDVLPQNMHQVGHQLGTKFNFLSLDLAQSGAQEYDEMRLFCTHFSSLTILDIRNCSMPMTMLARCLSQLRQLIHLDLHIKSPIMPNDGEQPEIVQIPSVRLLALSFITRSHLDSERLFISQIFPSVQVLRLEYGIRACQDCEIEPISYPFLHFGIHNIQQSEPELARRLTECTRLTRQPFRRCANLHTIELVNSNGNETLINIDDL